MQLFDFQHTIGQNIIYFIRLKGYTKSSLSRWTNIPKPDLDQLIKGEFSSPVLYQKQINSLTKSLNLPNDYFLKESLDRPEKWQLFNIQEPASSERSPLAQELLEDLDQLISIVPFYITDVKGSLKN